MWASSPWCAHLQIDFFPSSVYGNKRRTSGLLFLYNHVRQLSLGTLPTVEGQKEAGCPRSFPRFKKHADRSDREKNAKSSALRLWGQGTH